MHDRKTNKPYQETVQERSSREFKLAEFRIETDDGTFVGVMQDGVFIETWDKIVANTGYEQVTLGLRNHRAWLSGKVSSLKNENENER